MSDIDVYQEWLGIPEGDRPPDMYTLLRLVQFEDDQERIQGNYRKLNAHVRKYATGKYLVRSQELLNELAKAMLCLTDPVAKREYDESLGRDFSGEQIDDPETALDVLISRGVIDRAKASEIEEHADRLGMSIRDAIVQAKAAGSAEATKAWAVELRIPYVDLEDMLPDAGVLDQVPRRIVKRFQCLPLFEDRGRILVACAGEPEPALEDEIRVRLGMPMRPVLAVPKAITAALKEHYAPGVRDEVTETEVASSTKSGKKKGPGAGKPKPAKKKSGGKLTDEEKKKHQQVSVLLMCWTAMGTVGAFYSYRSMTMSTGYSEITDAVVGVVLAGMLGGLLRLTGYWK